MIRTGIGFDVHPFAAGRRLVLGGVVFPHTKGLDGHSDADVLCHAIADALLGATADGDIGMHFSNTDPRWKDASSISLLSIVVDRLRSGGWQIVNVDATVLAEAPKIAPFVPAMRDRLAGTLRVASDRVSVKASTMERLGAIGRSEGIAVMAVATVERHKGN